MYYFETDAYKEKVKELKWIIDYAKEFPESSTLSDMIEEFISAIREETADDVESLCKKSEHFVSRVPYVCEACKKISHYIKYGER